MRRTTAIPAIIAVTAGVVVALTAPAASAQERQAGQPAAQSALKAQPDANARAMAAADAFVAKSTSDAAVLLKGPGDTLVRKAVHAGNRGLRYVAYERTYRGLPVIGGDAVVATDANGAVKGTAVAQKTTITVGTTAKVSRAKAAATAKTKLAKVTTSSTPRLVVLAWGAKPALVWETVVEGARADNGPSRLHVFVDAQTGKVVDSYDDVREGAGTGFYYGSVTINTSGSGTSFSMTDTTRSSLRCGGQNGSAFTGTDDVWGNGSGTNLETACVDAMYGAQKQWDMLREWYGRNGYNGSGGSVPIRVGLSQVNAFWNGSYVNFGHNQANTKQATPIDVVAHEIGHAIFQFTPGGAGSGNENGGINEAASDIWGALTEAYVNHPGDAPDYLVGELVDLVGQGPIRNMYNPSLISGDPNCYSSSIPSTEVHAAAGPLNHWFYLVAEGSSPGGGKPASPTCNSSSVTGIGIRKAGEIFYNAELLKTSSWRYVNVRTASLTAAKNLYPGSCAEFNVVKAAWDAVSVPAQAADPTCNTSANDFSVSLSPTSGSVTAGGSATTTVNTAVTAGSAQTVALSASGLPAGATASFSPSSVTAGGSATLTIATAASTPAGTYTIAVTGTGSISHSASFTLAVGGAPGCSGSNGTDVSIPDNAGAVTSPIVISGCSQTPSSSSKVEVHIVHTYRGDLVIDLVAPDGTAYRLKSNNSDGTDNVDETYTVNLSSETANGTWTLRVQDVASIDTGFVNTWTLTL